VEELVRALAPAVVDILEALRQTGIRSRIIEQPLLVGHVVEEMLDVLLLELAGRTFICSRI